MNDAPVPDSAEILQRALDEYSPVVKVYVGFSGGRDSLAVTHWVMNNAPEGAGVFHLNTGIGIKRTREYVRETCREYGWPLTEVRAKEDCGWDYRELVKKHGFPGPAGHGMMYRLLKERGIRKLVRDTKTKRNQRVAIVTGIRKDESKRRGNYDDSVIDKIDAQIWVNPIYHWSRSERDAYIEEHNLPVNPVALELGMSGECLCGAFAHPGEKELVRLVDPDTAAYIDTLEEEVRACGYTWGWEDRPPRGQKTRKGKAVGPLCVGCEKVDD